MTVTNKEEYLDKLEKSASQHRCSQLTSLSKHKRMIGAVPSFRRAARVIHLGLAINKEGHCRDTSYLFASKCNW